MYFFHFKPIYLDMDEVFHIPQAQSYCKNQFFEVCVCKLKLFYVVRQCKYLLNDFFPFSLQWDNKITTLPGLYFITIGVLNPLSQWSNQWLCM